jgi:hypothetical protein
MLMLQSDSSRYQESSVLGNVKELMADFREENVANSFQHCNTQLFCSQYGGKGSTDTPYSVAIGIFII